MGYYSDFGLRLEFEFEKEISYIEGLFERFLEEEEYKTTFYEVYSYLKFEDIFQKITYQTRYTYDNKKVFVFTIEGEELKFYRSKEYEGRWVELFIQWLGDNRICELHYIRLGESFDDVEEIYSHNIAFPLSISKKIDFN